MKTTRLLSIAAFLAVPAFATPITFVGVLSALNEVPTNPSAGTGFATVVFDDTAHTLSVDVTFSGLTGVTTVSHIHCCALPGSNAGVATEVPSFSNLPVEVTSGVFTQFYDTLNLLTYNPAFITANGGSAISAEAALFAGLMEGKAYVNLHTRFRPGGEIRANLVRVPEPGSFALVAIATVGMMSMMFLLRRSTRPPDRTTGASSRSRTRTIRRTCSG